MSRSAYILGVYQAGIDSGRLAPTTFEKMAQQADIAAGATMDEMSAIGSSITAQDISSLAKILSVLTQLQQMYQDQSMMQPPMDPNMMQQPGMMQPPMDPNMMQPPMDPNMMQPPMGPPPQGMMAPGPGPAVQ